MRIMLIDEDKRAIKEAIIKLYKRVKQEYKKDEKYRKDKDSMRKTIEMSMKTLLNDLIERAIKQYSSETSSDNALKEKRDALNAFALETLYKINK
jgi:hypothetical protein